MTLFDRAYQHLLDVGVVAAYPAQLSATLVDLLGGGGERHLLGDLGGGLTDQTHVLDEDGQRRADVVEVTVDHALAAVAEHEGGGRAGAQDLVDLLQIQAHRVSERQGLPGRGDVHAAQQLVDDLEALTVAGSGPDHGGVGGQRVQHGADGLDIGLGAADHHQQVALCGAGGAAGDRRVDDVAGHVLEGADGVVDRGGADGGHDQQRRPRGQGRGDRKSTRLNSSHVASSYAVFCLKK